MNSVNGISRWSIDRLTISAATIASRESEDGLNSHFTGRSICSIVNMIAPTVASFSRISRNRRIPRCPRSWDRNSSGRIWLLGFRSTETPISFVMLDFVGVLAISSPSLCSIATLIPAALLGSAYGAVALRFHCTRMPWHRLGPYTSLSGKSEVLVYSDPSIPFREDRLEMHRPWLQKVPLVLPSILFVALPCVNILRAG